ncbi:MAG: tRNA adenosine(34) deaminase TadA [Saccharofermentanales bacterium]|jgi:tRNA(adenine34) deaminase
MNNNKPLAESKNHAAGENDKRWMRLALNQARKAAAVGETPIGAVIVHEGRVIGRGYNRRETRKDATEHAEIMAIRQASRRLKSWRLTDCELYVTLEPCLMCAGALINARIRRVVYAAADPKGGACGSVVSAQSLPLFHEIICEPGPLAAESAELLRLFFKALRTRDRERGSSGQRRKQSLTGQKPVAAVTRFLNIDQQEKTHDND